MKILLYTSEVIFDTDPGSLFFMLGCLLYKNLKYYFEIANFDLNNNLKNYKKD